MAFSKFNYSGHEKSISFTSVPGTYFWSNGYAWGTSVIVGKKADLKVLHGEISINQFTLEGIGTKKSLNKIIDENQNFVVEFE
jgi:hypothetical protein